MNRTFKYLIRALQSVSLCLLLCASWGCKKYSAECELVVMPRRLPVESSPKDGAAEMVRIYVYYIGQGTDRLIIDEVSNWFPTSYADASAGLVTNKNTREVISSSYVVEQSADNYIYMSLSSSPVLLVAVNAMDRYYAWRTFKFEIPMPQITMPVRFLLYKSTETTPAYKDLTWTVVSEKFEKFQTPENAPK